MATPQQKLPKGPSNSSGFGTPGTQQTAQRNVKTGGFDPNMPKAPQAARQARSSYQQSLGAPAGVPGAPASGYALFAGMPTQQAMGLNRSLGLSNRGPMGGGSVPLSGGALPPGLGKPPLPPSGAQGATAPRGTAEALQPDPVDPRMDFGIPGRGVDPRIQEEFGRGVSRAGVPDVAGQRGDLGLPGRGFDLRAGEADVPFSRVTDAPLRGEGIQPRDPSEQELATGEATTTEDMVWGMYSNGTMSAEEAQAALGMDGSEFAHWAVNKENQEKYGHLTDEEFALRQAQAVEDAKADARARLLAEGDRGDAADPGAARGGRLEANLAAREALGAPYVEDPSRLHAVATGKVLDPNRDVPGYEGEEVQKVKDNLAKQAEIAYQQNLDQLMRQFAVMGTAGSGAFMMANNNLAVQIYGKLLDEYAQIDLKNLDQIEIDLQEEIGNLVSLSQLGYANKEDFLDTLEKIDSVLFSSFTGMLEVLDLPEHLEAEMFADLAQFLSQHYSSFATGEVSKEDLIKMGNDHLSSMVEEYAETKASKEAVFSKLDEIVLEDSTKTASPPSGAEPPFYSGQYDGDVVEDSGNVWIWLDGEWTWYGVYDK